MINVSHEVDLVNKKAGVVIKITPDVASFVEIHKDFFRFLKRSVADVGVFEGDQGSGSISITLRQRTEAEQFELEKRVFATVSKTVPKTFPKKIINEAKQLELEKKVFATSPKVSVSPVK